MNIFFKNANHRRMYRIQTQRIEQMACMKPKIANVSIYVVFNHNILFVENLTNLNGSKKELLIVKIDAKCCIDCILKTIFFTMESKPSYKCRLCFTAGMFHINLFKTTQKIVETIQEIFHCEVMINKKINKQNLMLPSKKI